MDSNQPDTSTESSQTTTPTPVVTQSEVTPTIFTPRPPKKRKKGLIVAGVIAGALILLGGASALAYNGWYQNPEKAIFDALTNAFKAESISGEGSLTIKSKDANVKVVFDGEGRGSDGRMNAKVTIDGVTDGKDLSINVTAALLVKGDTIYFKLDNVRETVDSLAESLGDAPKYLDPIIKKIDGQWVSVKANDYEDISKEVAEQQRCMTKVFDSLSSNASMKQEVVTLYKKNRIIIIDEKLPAKDVNGVGSLGYEISADTDATKGFIKGLEDTEFGKALKDCDDDIDFTETADAISSSTEKSDSHGKVELWVSRFGHEITEIAVTGRDGDTSGSFVFHPIFNKDVTIEAPAGAITIKQLQEDIEDAIEEYYAEMYSQYDFDYEAENTSSYNFN